eukprot:scaffold37452_cov14-Tisochrysis_lutea.AAC.1
MRLRVQAAPMNGLLIPNVTWLFLPPPRALERPEHTEHEFAGGGGFGGVQVVQVGGPIAMDVDAGGRTSVSLPTLQAFHPGSTQLCM